MTLKLFFFCFAPSFTSSSILSLLLFFLLVRIGFYGQTVDAKTPPVPALIVFGDSIVDPGNNNKLGTLVKCNFPPYGKDFTQHIPTGRFCNGKIPSDLLGRVKTPLTPSHKQASFSLCMVSGRPNATRVCV